MSFRISNTAEYSSDESPLGGGSIFPLPEGLLRFDASFSKGHPLIFMLSECFVLENRAEKPLSYPVLPDGCAALLIFDDGDAEGGSIYSETFDAAGGKGFGAAEGDSVHGVFCGATEAARSLTLAPGSSALMLRFLPGKAGGVEGELKDFSERSVAITEAFPSGERILRLFEQGLPLSESLTQITRYLKRGSEYREQDHLLYGALDAIRLSEGKMRIAELAEKCGFSERYLGRVFEKRVGLSPKAYGEIVRFRHSLALVLCEEQKMSLPEIASSSGYRDHTHMNRAYRRFIDCSSGALRKKGLSALDIEGMAEYV